MSNASNLSTLANVLDDGSDGQFLKSTGSGGVAFDTVAAGAVVYATADLLPLSGFAAGDMAYVTATNRFYINNGSGWYSISLVNTNPNITSVQDASSGTTPFTLATNGTATVITVTAADPEGVPLTYGYSVTTGNSSLNGSTVAQGTGSNSNVFTVTPHASQDATFTITFTASDGINQATSANAFSLTFVTVVTDSNHTTLLATATGTSDNNNITDSSSNSHSITVNGDATAGTFSPYRSGGYSFYGHFRPETVSSTLDTYSLSFWYKLNSVVNDGYFFETQIGSFSMKSETDSGGRFEVGGAAYFQNDGSGNNYLDSNWHYFVVSRTSSATSWYIDGSQINTTSGGTVGVTLGSLSAQAVRNMTFGGRDATSDLGALATTNRANVEFRDIELKSTTHDGSVPTEPVTSSSDTVFLTAHKPYSGYDYGATPTSALIETLGTNFETRSTSPYDYNEYDAADHGGSVYFDGTDDRLETSAGKIPSGSTNFTVSCWFYSTRSSTDEIGAVFGQGAGSGGRVGIFLYGGTNTPIKYSVDSGDTDTGVFALRNVWYFVELQVTSSTAKMFINGVEESSKSLSGYSAPNTDLTIGNLGSSWSNNLDWTGYISDFLVQTGTPSGSSTVPTSSRSSSGAELHIKGTDASIIDKSQGANLKLVGNTTGSTTQVKFSNTKSMYFDGSGDYIDLERYVDIAGDFTFEAWVKPSTAWSGAVGTLGGDTDSGAGSVMRMNGSGNLSVYSNHPSNGGTIININGTYNPFTSTSNLNGATLTDYAWTHLALSRTGSTVYLYVNGIRNAQTGSGTGNLYFDIIGGQLTSNTLSNPYSGYIQDLRVSNYPRYTAADETSNIPSAPLEG